MLNKMKYSTIRNYAYLISLTGPLLTIFGNFSGGWWVGLNAFFYLVVLTTIEKFTPESKNNKEGDGNIIPDLILFIHVVLQIIVIYSFFWTILNSNLSPLQYGLAIFSTAINTGSSAIIISHELIHRKQTTWKLLGRLLLFTAGNPYFFIDHIKVHHKHVGTDKDSATAARGESIYKFFIRTAWGQFNSAYSIEKLRLKNEHFLSRIFNNYVIRSCVFSILLLIFLYFIGGALLLLAHVFHIILANFLLEYINYIEHYGLTRTVGIRVNETHSWQSDKVISRFFLIDLSRHSDHHNYASKPYHKLLSHQKSPVLPGGYLSLFFVVLLPSVWFRIVHPILDNTEHSD